MSEQIEYEIGQATEAARDAVQRYQLAAVHLCDAGDDAPQGEVVRLRAECRESHAKMMRQLMRVLIEAECLGRRVNDPFYLLEQLRANG
jgi:hypothetical protein